jgi:hypothetical protein
MYLFSLIDIEWIKKLHKTWNFRVLRPRKMFQRRQHSEILSCVRIPVRAVPVARNMIQARLEDRSYLFISVESCIDLPPYLVPLPSRSPLPPLSKFNLVFPVP